MMNSRTLSILFAGCMGFCCFGIPVNAAEQHYVVDNGWFFRNFGTAELTWAQYRDTFIGTPPDYASAPLDYAFYEGVYKNQISPPGNCYGMSLMSQLIRKKGGHLGYCYPVSQYSGGVTYPGTGPTDARLRNAINLMHGHQLNLNSIKQYLELLALGKTRDGNYAFQQAEYFKLSEDPTIVSITKSLSPVDGGHTLAVYETQNLGSTKRLYVYDPNRTWYDATSQLWYKNGNNYIEITSSSGKWSFDMGSETWTGSPSSGGNCIITPISIAGPRDRSPVSMGLDALSYLNDFFIYGSGNDIKQITNSQGKRLFKPGTKEIDIDPNTGLLNTVPIFPTDGNASNDFVSYVMIGNPGGALTVEVESKKNKGYRLEVVGPRSRLTINAVAQAGVDRITLENPGMITPQLSLKNTISAEKYDVQFAQTVRSGRETRVFQIKNLAIPPNNEVDLNITSDQKGVRVISPTAKLGYTMQIERQVEGQEKQSVEMASLALEAGQSQLVKPLDWKTLRVGEPRIENLAVSR